MESSGTHGHSRDGLAARDLADTAGDVAPGLRFVESVLDPLKRTFVGKDEVIDLLGLSLSAGENLFILGPPGTAKSALVHALGARLEGRTFDYLLTRFTEPNEIFGPFDIAALRDGVLQTNTDGMLPEADFVFLDELLNANSAILNSLLTVLNERRFRRGREVMDLPLLMVVGASNHLPQDDALAALFDRFLLRVTCDNVADEKLANVLTAGWSLEAASVTLIGNGVDGHGESPAAPSGFGAGEVRALQRSLWEVDLTPLRDEYVDLVKRVRLAGISISDRRAVKLQRLVAASALLCGRAHATLSDLWVFRHIWERANQLEFLAGIVDEFVTRDESGEAMHARARGAESPDPDGLGRELDALESELDALPSISDDSISALRDRLATLAARVEWVSVETAREHLGQQVRELWERFSEDD